MDFKNLSHRLGFAGAVVIIAAGAWFYFDRGEQQSPQKKEEPKSMEQLVAPPLSEAGKKEEAKKEITGAVLQTTLGEIKIEFFADKAPKTVGNFVKLAESGFYDGTKFHRVIKNFMIQSGDPLSKDDAQIARWGTGGPGYQFADEINDQKIVRGVLAMANSGPSTNGSQFFIVTAASAPWLDGKHTVFGKVVKEMAVVDKISSVEVGDRDIPKTSVIIESIVLK